MGTRIHKISRHNPSIFQGKFEFARNTGISLSREHSLERIALRTCALTLIVLLSGYFYFVSTSVLNVIARKEALSAIAVIQSEIGGLEKKFFARSEMVSPEVGSAIGLSPIAQTDYVYRLGNVGSTIAAQSARN